MAHFDRFVDVLYRYGAERLLLASDEMITLVSNGESRAISTQPVSLQQMQDLVNEIAPAHMTRLATQAGNFEFEYAAPGGSVRLRVLREPRSMRVHVEPLQVAMTAAPAASPSERIANGVRGAMMPAPGQEPARTAAPISARNDSRKPRIDALLEKMIELRCSDLHLCVGSPPLVRRDGEMTPLGDTEPLVAGTIRDLLQEITPRANSSQFEERHDTDFCYELGTTARFRCNLFMDRRGVGAVLRFIPARIPTAQELGLPKAVLDLCELPKGLVLVTGPTGSGKSTTLAAMIDQINSTRSSHIITIEDPIEFVHTNKRCLVNQREVGTHTEGFKTALRAALREDPDIVLVGEMRDLETVAIALETAETGHLVFGTLHTNTAASTVDRIIDQFPADRQAQVRTLLSESLRGVVAQTLVKKKGGGLVAAQEILLVNSAVSNLIREGKTFQIQSIIQTGRAAGMVTMHDALLELVKDGRVEPKDAWARAVNRAEFKSILERNSIRMS